MTVVVLVLLNPSSGIVPLWHTGPVAIPNGAAQALQAAIPPYSWSVRCPRSMRWVYISLVMIFGSVASQQLYATNIWYLNMMCQYVTRHGEAATHPGTPFFLHPAWYGGQLGIWSLVLHTWTRAAPSRAAFRMI